MFAAGAIFTIASGWIFSVEFQAFDSTQSDSLGRQTRVDPLADLPLSHRGQLDILRLCDQELSAPRALVKTGQSLKQDASSCLSISKEILTKSPSFGFAYLVSAKSYAQLGQSGLAHSALTKSAALAPFEGWQIQRRLRLSLDLRAAPDQIKGDVSVLLTTQSGAELAAKYYIKGAEIRAFVDDSLAVASQTDQARFLNLLQKYSGQS